MTETGAPASASPPLLARRRFVGGLALGATGGLASYALFVERLLVRLSHQRIAIADLPPSLDGLRILQLSDIHHGPWMGRELVSRIVSRAAGIPCDLIALTGDYVHGDDARAALEWVIAALSRLRAPLGVHAVLGNHDHYADGSRAKELLADAGISRVHSRVAIEREDGRLWLAGTGDLWEDEVSIDRVLAGVPTNEPRIVLAHNPDTADAPFGARVDLMLSGHTHGGQVRLPFAGALTLPIRNWRYASGLVATARTQLFVSRGLGWTVLPVRFNCPPEMALLELTRAPAPSTVPSASRRSEPRAHRSAA
ncbi:MAG: metallophosphoesterase [bacterium]